VSDCQGRIRRDLRKFAEAGGPTRFRWGGGIEKGKRGEREEERETLWGRERGDRANTEYVFL